MLTSWINVTRITIKGADRLYPNGLDWKISPGVNAIIGGTGLGKTTLVYALQFAVFGKTDKVNAQFANKWNLDWRYTKIAIDTDGTFYMTMDMNLDGGVTTANILADFSVFDDSIARLKQ